MHTETTGAATRPETWNQAITAWTRHLQSAGQSPDTITLRKFQMYRIAHTVPCANPWVVETAHLETFLAGNGWQRETIRSHRTALRSFYRWAVQRGYVTADPTLDLPRVKAAVPRVHAASETVVQQAFSDAADDERLALWLDLAANHGLRRGEIARVHSDHVSVDADGPWLEVQGKGDKARTIPLSPDAFRMLAARPAGYAFPGQYGRGKYGAKDGHISPYWVGRCIRAALDREATTHQLRHRFARQAYVNSGHDLETVRTLLGHASLVTTQTYVQEAKSTRARAVMMSAQVKR